MIELELKYRDLITRKANTEQDFKSKIDKTQNYNSDVRAQVENMKEQVHLLQLKNNQLTSDIKRQKTVNQARQDEL